MTTKVHREKKPEGRPINFPDTHHLSNKERAEADAAYLESIGYTHVKIVKHGRGYRVEASNVKEK
jgi:hypothetical protein